MNARRSFELEIKDIVREIKEDPSKLTDFFSDKIKLKNKKEVQLW